MDSTFLGLAPKSELELEATKEGVPRKPCPDFFDNVLGSATSKISGSHGLQIAL